MVVRASFEERDRYREVLNQAYADGRLPDAEFYDRLDKVDKLPYLRDLDRLIVDLPTPAWKLVMVDPRKVPKPAPTTRRSTLVAGAAVAGLLGLSVAVPWLFDRSSDAPVATATPSAPPEPVTPASVVATAAAWLTANDYPTAYSAATYFNADSGKPVMFVDVPAKSRQGVSDSVRFESDKQPSVSAGQTEKKPPALPTSRFATVDLVRLESESLRQLNSTAVDFVSWSADRIMVWVLGDAYGKGKGRIVWDATGTTITDIVPDN